MGTMDGVTNRVSLAFSSASAEEIYGAARSSPSRQRSLRCILIFESPAESKKPTPERVLAQGSLVVVTRRGFVCIFSSGENYGFARSSPRD